MRLLDRYDVRRVGPFDPDDGLPPRAAQFRDLDFILFGEVQEADREISLRLAVYSRSENDITLEYEDTITSVLDLFDAADDAAIAVLEGFSGELIRFATLRLRNTGSDGRYTVYLDDTPIGENVAEARVLVGTRTVRVVQDRMLREQEIYEGTQTFDDDQVVTVEFSIPLATSEERQTLTDLEQQILDDWDQAGRVPVVRQRFNRVFFLLDDISYSPGLAGYRDSFTELQEAYEARVAEGFEEEDRPEETIAEDEPEEAPEEERSRRRPVQQPVFDDPTPGPPEVTLAVGGKLGIGAGFWEGDDLGFDTETPDVAALFAGFAYYHLIPNLAIQAQLGVQRYAMGILPSFTVFDSTSDFTLHFWAYDVGVFARPTIRAELFSLYWLIGPQFTLFNTDVVAREMGSTEELDTFELETNPFFGFTGGMGFGFHIGQNEVFGEFSYSVTSFELFEDISRTANAIQLVVGFARHVY